MSIKLIVVLLAMYSILVTFIFLHVRSLLSKFIKATNVEITKAFEAGEQSKQHEIDELKDKIEQALNTVYAMKVKADCGHLSDQEQSFVYGFGYELHGILRDRK